MTIKVGIIGCGLMGSLHARTLHALLGVQVAAVHNRTREKAEALAAEVGAAVFDSYEALLAQDLDAVWVATPDHLHVDASIAVLESGKHLFLEKALATSVADGAKIVETGAKRPELKAMVGYPLRFAPAYRAMKEAVSHGDAGKPIQAWSMRTHFLDPNQRVYDKYRDHYYDTPGWYFNEADAKGPIFSHGSHDYDLLMWMCGEVESVFAYGGTYMLPPGSVADAFTVSLRFANGAIGQVSTPWVTRVEYDITGVATEKLTVVNNNGQVLIKDDNGPERKTSFSDNDMWFRLNGHFIDCIHQNKQPLISLEDGLRVIAVSEAAYRSLKERREVAVDYSALGASRTGGGV
ncbi:Gfo/Idh/MocA family protein [Paenibacillus allorhizosphaerae]|uniref:Myo-inositol 2-dehydrogenase n=1 Tax=Paenibacillus allorhizosphaerae TaxID=2849866 RepID=A0ABN7TTH5_9BACL|nr:Gfo/Idh/MocA family oxidoreductase [Paenibacillus allorhizosphaerae]CAG7655117.1 Myo-inositol 2-dehydrogenase [Paenibacillus allorhizosphaerae]